MIEVKLFHDLDGDWYYLVITSLLTPDFPNGLILHGRYKSLELAEIVKEKTKQYLLRFILEHS